MQLQISYWPLRHPLCQNLQPIIAHQYTSPLAPSNHLHSQVQHKAPVASQFSRPNSSPSMGSTGYQKVANVDYSLLQDILSHPDQLDKAYLSGAYPPSPEYPPSSFFDSESFFDQPLTTAEAPPYVPLRSPTFFASTLPTSSVSNTDRRSASDSSFRQVCNPTSIEQPLPSSFTFETATSEAFKSAYFTPITHISSKTPSLRDEAQQQNISPIQSPHVTKEEAISSPSSSSEQSTPKRTQRKRGRPRLDRSGTDAHSNTSSLASKFQRTGRLPHNQVERKYREGLNSELERLRRAVPSLLQSVDGDVVSQSKPSKATILAGAVDYIRKLESETNALQEENRRLRLAQERRRHGES